IFRAFRRSQAIVNGAKSRLSKSRYVVRAWLMDGYEGVEKLHLAEVPVPEPGPGQVLLKVRFAALNPADAFLAQAMYPAKPPLPHVLGRDGVGDVVAVGTGVDKALMGRIVGVVRSSVGVEAWEPSPKIQWFRLAILFQCRKGGPWKKW